MVKPRMKDYKLVKYEISTPSGIHKEWIAKSKKTGMLMRTTVSRTKLTAKNKLRTQIYG